MESQVLTILADYGGYGLLLGFAAYCLLRAARWIANPAGPLGRLLEAQISFTQTVAAATLQIAAAQKASDDRHLSHFALTATSLAQLTELRSAAMAAADLGIACCKQADVDPATIALAEELRRRLNFDDP
jgi:hypothetical protein